MKNPKATEHIHKWDRSFSLPKEVGRMYFYEALRYDQFYICKGCMQICRMVPGKNPQDSLLHVWITDPSEYNKIRREAMAWNSYAYQEEYKQKKTSSALRKHRR